MDPPEEQQEGVQQAEGGLGGLEAYGSLQELKLLAIVRRTFRGRVQLDSGWLKAAFSEYAVEAKWKCGLACREALGPRAMAAGDEEARQAGLARETFGGAAGLEPVAKEVYGELEELLAMVRRALASPLSGVFKLASLLAAPSVKFCPEAQRLEQLKQVRQQLEEHFDEVKSADNMIRPVMALQAVMDTFAVNLAALRLKHVYDELLVQKKCAPMLAEAADSLADAASAELFDVLNLLTQPGYAAEAVRLTLDWAEASTEVREFLEALATADNAKEKMGEFVHQFTYEQMGLVCAAAACCFTALSTLLVNLRDEELCGLLYDTLVLTCAVGYDPAFVNTVYVYVENGRHTALDALGLAAIHGGVETEMGGWVAALVERHYKIAELFDEEYSANLRGRRPITVAIAEQVQHAAAALGMKIGELAEQQTALAKQQAALAEQQAALAEQQQAAGQEVAELKAQHSVMAQQLGDMQELLVLSLMSALQQQPLTPVREGKAEAYLSRLAIGAAVAEGPIPFGSRVASPEPEEQQLQPESSAAASSRAAPAVAAEPAAAEAAPVAAAEAPAPAAVVAEPPQPAGGVAGGGQAAGRGGQAAGRPALFGTGRHAAQRGDLREAVRRVQQAADDQARRDRELYGNASGLRVRRMGGEGSSRTAPVASSAYSRPLLPRWQH